MHNVDLNSLQVQYQLFLKSYAVFLPVNPIYQWAVAVTIMRLYIWCSYILMILSKKYKQGKENEFLFFSSFNSRNMYTHVCVSKQASNSIHTFLYALYIFWCGARFPKISKYSTIYGLEWKQWTHDINFFNRVVNYGESNSNNNT